MVVTVVTLVVDGPVDFSRKEILFSWRSYDLGDIPLGRIRYHIALLGQLLH